MARLKGEYKSRTQKMKALSVNNLFQKKWVWVGILILVIVVGGLTLKDWLEMSRKKAAWKREVANLTYTTYKNDKFGISFEYPESWEIEETESGKPYVVRVLGPQGRHGLHTSLNLLVYPQGVIEGPERRQLADFEAFAEDRIAHMAAQGVVDIVSMRTSIAGQPARRVTYSATLSERLDPGAPLFRAKDSLIIFQRGPDIYELLYWTEQDLYEIFENVFNHAVETFRFID